MTAPRDVRVIHDRVLGRWEVGFVDALGTTFLLGDDPVRFGRDGSGAVAECVIDAEAVDDHALGVIRSAFGDTVADLVASLGDDDVDLVVSAAEPMPAAAAGGSSVPVRLADDSYAVDTTVGQVEVRVSRGVLRFRLPGADGSAGLWVRIASADSGALLGLARVVDDPAGGAVAEAVFGLDVDPTALSVSVTTEPLSSGAHTGSWPRPGRTVIGSGRRSLRRLALVAAGILLALAVTLLVGGGDPAEGPSSTTTSTTAATSTTVFVDPGPGDPGPVSFAYPGGDRVALSVEGVTPTAAPGSAIPVVVELTTAAFGGYGPAPGETVATEDVATEEERARANCLNVRDLDARGRWNLPPSTMTVHLVRVAPAPPSGIDPERLVLGRVTLIGEPATSSTDEESCRSATLTASGFNALTFVRREPQTVELAIPEGMAPGLWEVTVDLDGETGMAEGRLRLRIEPGTGSGQ